MHADICATLANYANIQIQQRLYMSILSTTYYIKDTGDKFILYKKYIIRDNIYGYNNKYYIIKYKCGRVIFGIYDLNSELRYNKKLAFYNISINTSTLCYNILYTNDRVRVNVYIANRACINNIYEPDADILAMLEKKIEKLKKLI